MSTKNLCRLPEGKCGLMALCLCFVAWSASNATPISIDLGPSPNITTHRDTFFNDLNGTPLQSQTLSLNFLFADGKFARLFSVTDAHFAVLITLKTSGSGVGFFQEGSTGFLLNQNGRLGNPEMLGAANPTDDSMSASLFPLLSGQFSTPLDFFGVHTKLLLPSNPSLTVTGGEFQLVSFGAGSQDVFGIGPGVPRDIVPDSGSTLLLFGLTLLALPAIYRQTLIM
jgi:hypothetical protein